MNVMVKLVEYRENSPMSFIGRLLFSTAPIPGGCNMEFDIEVAPYQKLHIENEMIIVDTQPASILADNISPTFCEINLVQHKMYRLYLPRQDFTPETYFEAIASMLTTQNILQNGDEVSHDMTILTWGDEISVLRDS